MVRIKNTFIYLLTFVLFLFLLPYLSKYVVAGGDSVHPGSALGGAEPNAFLCKTCIEVLCVLEQSKVDNSSAVPVKRGEQVGTTSPIHLLPDPCTSQSGEQVGTTSPIHLLPDPCTP